jgi:eukaryotic-like serine/threonine-protein kinase
LPHGAALASVSAGVRQAAGSAVATLRGLPPKGRIAVAAGAAVGVLLLGIAAVALFGGSDTPGKPAPHPVVDPNKPLIDGVQAYTDKGLTINLPKSWRESGGSTFVDYTDPADGGRRARINVEKVNTQDAHQVAAAASRGLDDPKRCPSPYHQLHITDLQMAGRSAAELEYTCGSGPDMRHGIWRFVIAGGKSYNFFVSVPDSRFAESKVIYDEMVRSFHLTI